MKILLDNNPKGVLSNEQRRILIKAARKWVAHYLTYATELDGKLKLSRQIKNPDMFNKAVIINLFKS